MTPRSNAPYEPVFYPEMGEPWRSLFAQFLHFCEAPRIPSKDLANRLCPLWGSQRYAIEEIFYGFSIGVHDFVLLKARQLGLSPPLGL